MTSDVNISSALNSAQNTQASTVGLAEDFSDFLNLLTVQLQNQDPLSPMDTTEFTNQLVAFTGVEQQINTNQRLDDLVALGLGDSFSSTLGYVGRNISYISSEAFYDGNTPVDISYAITGDSVETTINIFDESGDVVFSEQVSDDDVQETFTWDGTNDNGSPVDAGTYSIRVDAIGASGEPLETTTVVTGRVTGVETQNGVNFLLVGERAVSIGNVINVTEANTAQSQTSTEDTEDNT